MDDHAVIVSAAGLPHARSGLSVEELIRAWLHEKWGRTESERTKAAYAETLAHFRAMLRAAGLDLESDPEAIAFLAQGWAATPWRPDRKVGPATHNLRLAIVSSFYRFALRRASRQFHAIPSRSWTAGAPKKPPQNI